MWVDILSMLAAGAFAACLVFIAQRYLRRKQRPLPRWSMPAAIGATMIVFSIWNEYTWFDRITRTLPASMVIVAQGERSAPWAPWTYLQPVTVRFAALDKNAIQRSDSLPHLARANLVLVERWQNTRLVPVALDCKQQRQVTPAGAARLSADGQLTDGQWIPIAPTDPLFVAAC
jgi:hypothetical protein